MKKAKIVLLFSLFFLFAFTPIGGYLPTTTAYAESVTKSGPCGENATWELKNGVLTFSCSGVADLDNTYSSENDSQYVKCEKLWSTPNAVKKIIINEGITELSSYVSNAFADSKPS
jgi:hypothetical protein